MRNYISEALALDLYHSLIEPHFLYADVAYDGGAKSVLQNLQVSQNNALRVMKNVDKCYSATALHWELNADWLRVARQKCCCIEAFKSMHQKMPSSMQRQFLIVESRRDLRSNSDLTFMPHLTHTKFADSNLEN